LLLGGGERAEVVGITRLLFVIVCSLSFETRRRDDQANAQGEQGLDVRTAGSVR
jgi:hypothetical protein